SAAGILNVAPKSVALTFDEAVEPKFAIISVTDKDATQETTGSAYRSPSNPDTLIVPLRHIPEGWYLVYWRVVSVDGHPVQSAFTCAVGPNPGPQPQFVVPHIAQTATSPRLVAARWAVFVTVLAMIGLLVLRLWIARPVVRCVPGATLRPLNAAFFAVAAVAL